MDTEKNAGGTRQIWFAAANSEHGFENHFPALFSAGAGADALYIVKGAARRRSAVSKTIGGNAYEGR